MTRNILTLWITLLPLLVMADYSHKSSGTPNQDSGIRPMANTTQDISGPFFLNPTQETRAAKKPPKRFAGFSDRGNGTDDVGGFTLLKKTPLSEGRCRFSFATAAHVIPTLRGVKKDPNQPGNKPGLAKLKLAEKDPPGPGSKVIQKTAAELKVEYGPKYQTLLKPDGTQDGTIEKYEDDFALVSFESDCQDFADADVAELSSSKDPCGANRGTSVSGSKRNGSAITGQLQPNLISGKYCAVSIANPMIEGDSGGPAYDDEGRLVGIIAIKYEDRAQFLGQPIPTGYKFGYSPNSLSWLKSKLATL